jgi:hypothetical protein
MHQEKMFIAFGPGYIVEIPLKYFLANGIYNTMVMGMRGGLSESRTPGFLHGIGSCSILSFSAPIICAAYAGCKAQTS